MASVQHRDFPVWQRAGAEAALKPPSRAPTLHGYSVGSWQPGLPGWTGDLDGGSRSHGSNTVSLSNWPCHLNRLQNCGRGGVSTPGAHGHMSACL